MANEIFNDIDMERGEGYRGNCHILPSDLIYIELISLSYCGVYDEHRDLNFFKIQRRVYEKE